MILERIRALCAERGVTIKQLERETGISNGIIAKWGDSNPRVDNAKAVADFFGVTVDDLLKEG
jgi:transcriptional regulator with XRE-family HTH domain